MSNLSNTPSDSSAMDWVRLLSLNRQGDTAQRLRKDQDPTRLGFEVDYDRVIFSAPFRSLQDKTQVIPLSDTDFVHTRLTHSLEVSVVGRSLGRLVGQQILEKHPELNILHGYEAHDFGAIVAAAACAHDIGNPPFGHSGEKAIGAFFSHGPGAVYKDQLTDLQYQELIDFEGNANGFRLLNASRPGVPGGLRLSYATLGAFTKYPKAALPKKPTALVSDKKYGLFSQDLALYRVMAENMGLKSMGKGDQTRYARHPLAFLVEAADDICYTIIDFEDGIHLGLIAEDYALEYLIKLVKDSIQTEKYHSMSLASDRLSYLRALAINTLIGDAARVFMEHEQEILQGTWGYALLDKSQYTAQIKDIIDLSVKQVYQCADVVQKEISGYRIISDLLEVLVQASLGQWNGQPSPYDKLVLRMMPGAFDAQADSVYGVLLGCCAYVASLSDGRALHLHQRIQGKIKV